MPNYAVQICPYKTARAILRAATGISGDDTTLINTLYSNPGVSDALPFLRVSGKTAGQTDIDNVNAKRQTIVDIIFNDKSGTEQNNLINAFCTDLDCAYIADALDEMISLGSNWTNGSYAEVNQLLNARNSYFTEASSHLGTGPAAFGDPFGLFPTVDIWRDSSRHTPYSWRTSFTVLNYSPTILQYYNERLQFAHKNWNTHKSLIYTDIRMDKNRIRTYKKVTTDSNVVNVYGTNNAGEVGAQFTTDFRYMKKDPNGQFVAGGLRRCPTFSGQSSSGYIPDDVNKGHALFSSYLDNSVLSPSSHQYSTPYVVFAKSFTSSAYTYKLRSKITQEIRLPPSGGYSSGTFFLSAGVINNFTIKVRAFNLNWSNKTLASGTTTFDQTSYGAGQYGTVSTNIILWPSFGNLLYETDANGRPIPPTPGEELFHRIAFASPIDQFVETDANGERWIRPCYIEQEIPGNWYTAPFEQSAIYSSNVYYSGGLKAAMADNTAWPTVDSEGKPIYIRLYHGFTAAGQIFGNLPATNFDFAETV